MKSFLSLLLAMAMLYQYGFSQKEYAIVNVTVIPMHKEAAIPGQTVLVKNGRIIQVADAAKVVVPATASSIDGTGKFLMPGLFDMHAHFFYEQGEHVNTCKEELGLMLAKGLTTVRIMAGHEAYLEARSRIKASEWNGPELFVASPQFVGQWPWSSDFKNYVIVDSKEKAGEAVKKVKTEGYDEIKISFMIRSDVYDAIVQAAKETGLKVVGHVGPGVPLTNALKAGQQIEHMDEFIDRLLPDTSYNDGQSVSDMNIWRQNAWETVPFLDETKLPALIKQVKDSRVYVTPTNYFFISSFGQVRSEEEIKSLPGYQYIPSAILPERWNVRNHYLKTLPSEDKRKKYVHLRNKMVYDLWKAGVPLMAGSDSPEWFLVQGFAIHDELESFVKAGLSPFAALQTATVYPATHLGIIDRTGTIEKGKEADLLLLDKNPLEDIRHTQMISGVLAGGKFYDRQAINGLLALANQRKN
jgi:imidazolonepropionase-like amidohydrolase